MQAPTVTLSLQFARFPNVAKHRAALPRHMVARCVKHALQMDVESMEITVRIASHPVFTRDGQDLRCTLPLSFPQAALGAMVAARIGVPDGCAGSE